jgi:hypothetical protein
VKTAEEYTPTKGSALPSLVAGANIAGGLARPHAASMCSLSTHAGFLKVAEAMHAQGDFW